MDGKDITAGEEFFFTLERMSDADRTQQMTKLVISHEPESDWLEFKQVRQVSDKLNSEWSKSLSAFSNTSGGIIIWGIQTEKCSGRDVATALAPINDPTKLMAIWKSAD